MRNSGMNMSTETPILTEQQLLARVPVCRRTLLAWRKSGKVPFIKSGRSVLYHWPSVEAALVRQQEQGGAAA